jgi:hypothetical protein
LCQKSGDNAEIKQPGRKIFENPERHGCFLKAKK